MEGARMWESTGKANQDGRWEFDRWKSRCWTLHKDRLDYTRLRLQRLANGPGDVEQLKRLESGSTVSDDVIEQRGSVRYIKQQVTDAEPAEMTYVSQQSPQLVQYLSASAVDHRPVAAVAVARLTREREFDLIEPRHRIFVEELEETRDHLARATQHNTIE